jgi:hypothetical protein
MRSFLNLACFVLGAGCVAFVYEKFIIPQRNAPVDAAASSRAAPAVPSTPSQSAPTVSLVATVPTATIGKAAAAILTFSLNGTPAGALTVGFALSGTAVKWIDYYRMPEGDMPVSVTIPAGASSATLAITAKGNSTGANPETATFTLSADSSYTVGTANTATITILPPASAP